MGVAHLTENLAFLLTIIPHKIVYRSITCRTVAVIRNVAFYSSENRTGGLMITLLIVGNKIQPVPFLFEGNYSGEFVGFELLILGRMGIIVSPLF